MEAVSVILMAIGILNLLGLGAFGAISLREGEQRAAGIASGLSIALALPFLAAPLLVASYRWGLLGVTGAVLLICAVLFLLPVGRVERYSERPAVRIDERDIMFARARLEPGTPDYEAYYELRSGRRRLGCRRGRRAQSDGNKQATQSEIKQGETYGTNWHCNL